MNINKKPHDQSGFTIIELMIATTIFSLVLMICLSGILFITRMYQQGTIQAKTQETSRELIDVISDSIRYSRGSISQGRSNDTNGELALDLSDTSTPARNDFAGYICIGSQRYRFILNHKKVTEGELGDNQTRNVLVRDSIPEGQSCRDERSVDAWSTGESSSQDLLSDNYSLLDFSVKAVDSREGVFDVSVVVAYGDVGGAGNELSLVENRVLGDSESGFICRPENPARVFCAVSELQVTVEKRF